MTKLTISTVRVALREVGVVIKRTEGGEFRVNFRQAGEATAYYTNDLQDALDTGLSMARQNGGAVLASSCSPSLDAAAMRADPRYQVMRAALERGESLRSVAVGIEQAIEREVGKMIEAARAIQNVTVELRKINAQGMGWEWAIRVDGKLHSDSRTHGALDDFPTAEDAFDDAVEAVGRIIR
jgi:hypothetical protein